MNTVLIVDEDAFTRNVFAETLNNRGFDVRHADDAASARTELKSGPVDLIVVDGQLPDLDAIDFVAELRERGMDTPVVYLSSVFRKRPDEYERLTEEFGVRLVLHKPISPVEFCAQVENIFDISQERKWWPATGDIEVIEEAESARLAYATTLEERLRQLEDQLTEIREGGGDVGDTANRVAIIRGAASRYGFFAVSRAAGRIEATFERLTDRDGPPPRVLWNQIFDALDDAIVALRSPLRAEVEGADDVRQSASVLVVDDDPAFLEEVERFGAENFIRVVTARHPSEVLDLVRDPLLDALLVDVDLGEGFDTFAFVRRLRERASVNRIPLGFVADLGTVPDRVVASHLGASVFVEKPIDSTQFADIVHRLTSVDRTGKPVVLIVERDPAFIRETSDILVEAGMEPRLIKDTREVVERLDEFAPHGLVANVSMPGIGGFDLCRMIRAMPRWHDLPILLVGDRMDAETRIAAFRAGADDYLLSPPIREELLARLQVRIERLRLLREQAQVDMLTGLLTRRPFLHRVNARLSEVRRGGRDLALGLLDLDRFKEVNDTFGHIAGDRVLAALGRLLANRFRMEDLRARWGGEEFMVALVDEDADTAKRVLQRTLDEFSEMEFVGDEGERFGVTFSAGVAVFPDDGEDFRELLTVADRRLYEAKSGGRNQIVAA